MTLKRLNRTSVSPGSITKSTPWSGTPTACHRHTVAAHDRNGPAFAVGVVNGPVAGGQDLLSAGRVFVAASGGRLGFCLGLDGGQAGFLRAESGWRAAALC